MHKPYIVKRKYSLPLLIELNSPLFVFHPFPDTADPSRRVWAAEAVLSIYNAVVVAKCGQLLIKKLQSLISSDYADNYTPCNIYSSSCSESRYNLHNGDKAAHNSEALQQCCHPITWRWIRWISLDPHWSHQKTDKKGKINVIDSTRITTKSTQKIERKTHIRRICKLNKWNYHEIPSLH